MRGRAASGWLTVPGAISSRVAGDPGQNRPGLDEAVRTRPPSLTRCPLCPHSVPERVREARVHREQRVLSPRVFGQLQRARQRHGLRRLQALLLLRRVRAHLPAQHLPLRGLALRGPRLLRQHPQCRGQRLGGVRHPRRRVHAGVPLWLHPERQSEVSHAVPPCPPKLPATPPTSPFPPQPQNKMHSFYIVSWKCTAKPLEVKYVACCAGLGMWRSQSPLPALTGLPAKEVWGRPQRMVHLGCPIPGATQHQLCEVLGSGGEKTSPAPNSVLEAGQRVC